MPTLHLRGNSFYLVFPLDKEAGPFVSLAEAEEFLEWVDSRK